MKCCQKSNKLKMSSAGKTKEGGPTIPIRVHLRSSVVQFSSFPTPRRTAELPKRLTIASTVRSSRWCFSPAGSVKSDNCSPAPLRLRAAMPIGYAAPAVAGAEAAWSGGAMTGRVIATVFVPLVGLIMGPMNLGKPARKGQAIALLIVGIVMALIYIGSAAIIRASGSKLAIWMTRWWKSSTASASPTPCATSSPRRCARSTAATRRTRANSPTTCRTS